MSEFADLSIRDQGKLFLNQIERTLKRYEKLNDPLFVLDKNFLEMKRILNQYKIDLKKPISRFFSKNTLEKVVMNAEKEFKRVLKSFVSEGVVSLKKEQMGKVITSFQTSLSWQFNSIIDEMVGRQRVKVNAFKFLADWQRPTAKDVISDITKRFTPSGTKIVFDIKEVKTLWNFMVKRYGEHDIILYRPAKNTGIRRKVPLEHYIDQKMLTVASDAHRTTMMAEMSNNKVYFARISKHGALDSCRFHENEVIFINEASKNQYLKEHPENVAAIKIKTFQELELGPTHIFKWHCKHKISPLPIQFQSEKVQENNIEKEAERKKEAGKIPKKINEREIVNERKKQLGIEI